MRTIRTPEKRARFLATLAEGLSVNGAASAAGISRRAAYEWRAADPAFAADWEDALEAGTDELEDIARQRAEERSDVLLIFLLKARRREKYADLTRTRITGANDGPVKVEDTRPPIESLLQLAANKARAMGGDGAG